MPRNRFASLPILVLAYCWSDWYCSQYTGVIGRILQTICSCSFYRFEHKPVWAICSSRSFSRFGSFGSKMGTPIRSDRLDCVSEYADHFVVSRVPMVRTIRSLVVRGVSRDSSAASSGRWREMISLAVYITKHPDSRHRQWCVFRRPHCCIDSHFARMLAEYNALTVFTVYDICHNFTAQVQHWIVFSC